MKRIESLDIAKGIAISAVVLFHLPKINQLTGFNNWGGVIQTIYMPVFFTISGILHKDKGLTKSIRSLLAPYITFYMLAAFLDMGKDVIKGVPFDLSYYIAPFIGHTSDYPNTAVWFLCVLFMIKFIIVQLDKIHNIKTAILISICLSLIGYIYGIFHGAYPYYISVALLCQIFYYLGYKLKNLFISPFRYGELVLLLIIAYCIHYFGTDACNVSQNYIPIGYLNFVILSLVATRILICISDWLTKAKNVDRIFSYYGRNSLIVFGTHLLLIGITPIFGRIIPMPDVYIPLTLVAIMILEIPIIWFFNNYGKILIGKSQYAK